MGLVRSQLAFLILLLAAVRPQSLLAQYQKYEGQPVVNIRFVPAEQPLEGAELFEMLPMKRDEPLRMPVVRASIERLFATGRYRDIQVNAEPYNGGVIVTFVTTNNANPPVVSWPAYVSYQWYKNGSAIANATSSLTSPPPIRKRICCAFAACAART